MLEGAQQILGEAETMAAVAVARMTINETPEAFEPPPPLGNVPLGVSEMLKEYFATHTVSRYEAEPILTHARQIIKSPNRAKRLAAALRQAGP